MVRNRFINGKNPYENGFFGWTTTTGSSDEFIFNDGLPVIATKISNGTIGQYVDLTGVETVYGEVNKLPGATIAKMTIKLGTRTVMIEIRNYRRFAITVPEDQRTENKFCSFGTFFGSQPFGIRNITTTSPEAGAVHKVTDATSGVGWTIEHNSGEVSYRIKKVL